MTSPSREYDSEENTIVWSRYRKILTRVELSYSTLDGRLGTHAPTRVEMESGRKSLQNHAFLMK